MYTNDSERIAVVGLFWLIYMVLHADSFLLSQLCVVLLKLRTISYDQSEITIFVENHMR